MYSSARGELKANDTREVHRFLTLFSLAKGYRLRYGMHTESLTLCGTERTVRQTRRLRPGVSFSHSSNAIQKSSPRAIEFRKNWCKDAWRAARAHCSRKELACRPPKQIPADIVCKRLRKGALSSIESERERVRRHSRLGGRDCGDEERIDVAVFGSMRRYALFALATTCTRDRDIVQRSFVTRSLLGLSSPHQATAWVTSALNPTPSKAALECSTAVSTPEPPPCMYFKPSAFYYATAAAHALPEKLRRDY